MEPRAYTKDEVIRKFLETIRVRAQYWSELSGITNIERCNGLAFSILNIIDGSEINFPAIDLQLSPRPEDINYSFTRNENYYMPGMIFNDDCHLHELFYIYEVAEG